MKSLSFNGTEKEVTTVDNSFKEEFGKLKVMFKEDDKRFKELQHSILPHSTNRAYPPQYTFEATIFNDTKNMLVSYLLLRLLDNIAISVVGKDRINYS